MLKFRALFLISAFCLSYLPVMAEPRLVEVDPVPTASATDLLYSPISKDLIREETKTELPGEVYLDIIADEVQYNQEKNFYKAEGGAETYLPGQNAKLFADYISYDSEKELLEAFGNIKIIQAPKGLNLREIESDAELSRSISTIYGSYASFNTTNNKYELQEPRIYVNGLKLKARTASSTYYKENKKGKPQDNVVHLDDGIAAFDEPISMYSHGNRIRTRYSREQRKYNLHRRVDWDDVSDKQSFKYSAKEIYYDNTRKTNNLRIRGARMWLTDKLSVPSPVQITTTVGEASNTRFKGPIIGTRERLGGFAIGPRFFFEADRGVFSLVPVAQVGNGPSFGGGLVGTFNTPGDTTAIMGGYGSLDNRFIANVHQEIFGRHLQLNALLNQFQRESIFGNSQVGQLHDISTDNRIKMPFIDERGMRIRAAAGWAKDNNELFSGTRREQLAEERESGGLGKEHSGFRSEFETSFYTVPVWRRGNELYNISLRGRGQGAFRFYGTGDFLSIGRFGPSIEARVNNLSFEVAYLFAAIAGESPFLFDQFVDGSQSVLFDGDYKVNKWFSIGTLLTYNMERERFTRNQLRTEFGSKDFKLRLSYDVIRNQIGIGFNVIFSEPIEFDHLRVRI